MFTDGANGVGKRRTVSGSRSLAKTNQDPNIYCQKNIDVLGSGSLKFGVWYARFFCYRIFWNWIRSAICHTRLVCCFLGLGQLLRFHRRIFCNLHPTCRFGARCTWGARCMALVLAVIFTSLLLVRPISFSYGAFLKKIR